MHKTSEPRRRAGVLEGVTGGDGQLDTPPAASTQAAAPAVSPQARGATAISIVDWRPLPRNTLCGFATIRVDAWHLVVADVAVHRKGDQRWVQLPGRPVLDRDRQLFVRDGKIQYARSLWFDDTQVGRRFSDAVVDAVAAFDSSVFAGGEP